MKYAYQAVERTPKLLEPGIIYHNAEFQLAALLCACGCGHRVSLLVPESHQIEIASGVPTVRPSIAVCDAACKSHYLIVNGDVKWLRPFTENQATFVMTKQIARHVAAQPKKPSWAGKMHALWLKLIKLARAALRLDKR